MDVLVTYERSEDLPISVYSSGASIGNPTDCHFLHLRVYSAEHARPLTYFPISTLFRALLEHLPNPKMATIQVLDNPTIHNLLINLSKEETTSFRDTIEQTLEAFSINGERQYQPPPSIVNRPNGTKHSLPTIYLRLMHRYQDHS